MIADLTYWYGVDVGSLPADRQIGLLANLPRIQAQQQIRDGKYDPMDYEAVYDLWLLAYGDEQLAIDAEAKSKYMLMRRETEAARMARMPKY